MKPVDCLEQWVAAGWLRRLDLELPSMLKQALAAQGELLDDTVFLLVALLSHQVGRGHVCLDLKQLLQEPERTLALPPDGQAYPLDWLSLFEWLKSLSYDRALHCLKESAVVRVLATSEDAKPLVLDEERLYLQRLWSHEQTIAWGIRQRLKTPEAVPQLAETLKKVFPDEHDPGMQKVACALAARSRFSVITGGPGTGKTTTVLRLLAVLQSLALSGSGGRALQIRLAAPTGKAASRLTDSIRQSITQLHLNELPGQPKEQDIPSTVTTVHRLLGSRPGSRRFAHDATEPLPLDVLVIDEASMVDVELMAAVIEALPKNAKLVLLGDKDQLSSVDAGAVLGELCRFAEAGNYQPDVWAWLNEVVGYDLPENLKNPGGLPLDQSVAMLRHSYRFDSGSGIGRLARAANNGELPQALLQGMRAGRLPDIFWQFPQQGPVDLEAVVAHIAQYVSQGGDNTPGEGSASPDRTGYRHYLEEMHRARPGADASQKDWDRWALAVLDQFSRIQVLCALREGAWGVKTLNQAVEAELARLRLLDAPERSHLPQWYPGRPVMITRNDYALGLMNGDIGIALPRLAASGQTILQVAFPDASEAQAVRWVSASRLKQVETVFAMTVHKSQGSEFSHCCLVLPDYLSALITRELIYTGVTRARHRLSVMGPYESVLLEGVRRRLQRVSGLSHALEAE